MGQSWNLYKVSCMPGTDPKRRRRALNNAMSCRLPCSASDNRPPYPILMSDRIHDDILFQVMWSGGGGSGKVEEGRAYCSE